MTEVKRTTSLRSQLPLSERWRNVKVNALLVFVSMIWGSSFLIVQQTIRLTGPFTFLAMRFCLAALVLAVIFHKRLAQITHAEIITGSFIGLFLFGTCALQTTGFQFTFGLGEYLVMGCALASALHVIFISKFAPRVDAMNLALVQITITAALSLIAMPIAREPFVLPPLPVWGSALFLGVAATAFALAVMNRVQQSVSSTHATLIYALELVWVGMLGSLAGEHLSLFAWIGCGCILLGMITSGLRLAWIMKKSKGMCQN